MFLRVAVPINGVVDPIIEPGFLHDVYLRTISTLVSDPSLAGVIEPERRPVTGLLLKLDTSHMIAECMLELASCAGTSVNISIVFLEGSYYEMPLPVR
jgi:hypothetical protein